MQENLFLMPWSSTYLVIQYRLRVAHTVFHDWMR